MTKRNAFYAQSGGVTSVINASAAGVIDGVRAHSDKIGTLYAGQNGILGALHENLIDTGELTDTDIAALKQTPGGAFGSCRYKLKDIDSQRAAYERLIEVFKTHNIGYFFYNGGNDSQDTAHKVAMMAEQMDYPLVCMGVPKTVDNDLPHTDCCPGFGSVAKYVATSIKEASLDVAAMAETSTKVFILEVMGRHAGWIAASGALARDEDSPAPHIIVLPEKSFDEAAFLAKVSEAVKLHGFCSIVVSEGVRDASGRFLSETGSVDAFGHSQLGGVAPVLAGLVKQKLGFKYHWAVADYLQRSARHIASKTDVDQAYALGKAAVTAAIDGHHGQMMTVVRTNDAPYEWKVGYTPLDSVANQERFLPEEFMSEDGLDVTPACIDYLRPLIMGEAFPSFKDGVPDYWVSKLSPIQKQLPEFSES